MTDVIRRRRRLPISCTLCRKRKLKCNREHPCSNCLRSRGGDCVFDGRPPSDVPRLHRHPGEQAPKVLADHAERSEEVRDTAPQSDAQRTTTSASSSTGLSGGSPDQQTARELEALQTKVRVLENRLQQTSAPPNNKARTDLSSFRSYTPSTSQFGEKVFIHDQAGDGSQRQDVANGVVHKTRRFGQSHWMNGTFLFRDLFGSMGSCMGKGSSVTQESIQRCKALGKMIKARRRPQWPTPATSDLPPRDICDSLVEAYLRTTECVYRVLCLPDFRSEYERLWQGGTLYDTNFLVQLKLVMAIGAFAYDDGFTLRATATRWIYEAHTWLAEPGLKSRLNLQTLQTNILLLLAQEIVDVGGDMIWISAGSLLRTAVFMGLHRDPTDLNVRNVSDIEMRRRLWNTVLELSLQWSINSGVPALTDTKDFDTVPPSNLNDADLSSENPRPREDNELTDTTVAVALGRTFPIRLAIAKHLNDRHSMESYDETLRLDNALRTAYKSLNRDLRNCGLGKDGARTPFAMQAVDAIMQRYLLVLHAPYVERAIEGTAYAFSRKVVVDSALALQSALTRVRSLFPAGEGTTGRPRVDADFDRLITSGSGFFRTGILHAVIMIAFELLAEAREQSESLGPITLRQDLLAAVEDARVWSLKCIQAGDMNIKAYLMMTFLNESIAGSMGRYNPDVASERMVSSAKDAAEYCQSVLQNMYDRDPSRDTKSTDLRGPSEPLQSLNLITQDTMLSGSDLDLMSWMFGIDQLDNDLQL